MKKVFAFDLDNTLAELGKKIPEHIVQKLRIIEDAGHFVAICSGKPVYYLCGMMRQAGLSRPVLVGENGAVIQFGVDLPPKRRYKTACAPDAVEAIQGLRRIIEQQAGFDVWFQPNEVCLTPFYSTAEEGAALEKLLREHGALIDAYLDCFKHCDSFDLTPKGVNKKSGLSCLSGILGIERERFIATGDGENDYPMFEYAKTAIGVRIKEEGVVDRNFDSIDDALEYLLEKHI